MLKQLQRNTGTSIEVENPFDKLEEHLEKWLHVCFEEPDDDIYLNKYLNVINKMIKQPLLNEIFIKLTFSKGFEFEA